MYAYIIAEEKMKLEKNSSFPINYTRTLLLLYYYYHHSKFIYRNDQSDQTS